VASPTVKSCEVAVDLPEGPRLCTLQLAATADIDAALQAARLLIEAQGIDWQSAPVGIWGQLKARDTVPADGDRIELYRPLRVDPRQRRRERARAARR
jgi:putative ubiquitin-RnfH superfamily antitoxin RatB of RatAB toxin-antitoxin module